MASRICSVRYGFATEMLPNAGQASSRGCALYPDDHHGPGVAAGFFGESQPSGPGDVSISVTARQLFVRPKWSRVSLACVSFQDYMSSQMKLNGDGLAQEPVTSRRPRPEGAPDVTMPLTERLQAPGSGMGMPRAAPSSATPSTPVPGQRHQGEACCGRGRSICITLLGKCIYPKRYTDRFGTLLRVSCLSLAPQATWAPWNVFVYGCQSPIEMSLALPIRDVTRGQGIASCLPLRSRPGTKQRG